MLAIIKTGGKQYLVSPGQTIKIEAGDKKVGEEIEFSEVLLVEKDEKIKIGNPLVKGAKVIGRVKREGKEKKVIVLKYKKKKRYRIKRGHRQPFSEVEILTIELGNSDK